MPELAPRADLDCLGGCPERDAVDVLVAVSAR
jgi:hypothetical protein